MKKGEQNMPGDHSYKAVLKGFTPVLDVLVQQLDMLTALIYGVVWRYCQDEDRVCRASLETIASRVGVSRKTAERRIKTLCEYGFLVDMTPGRKNAPHIYADSGKARITGTVEAKIGETESPTSSRSGKTHSITKTARSDRETYRTAALGQTQGLMKKEVVVIKNTTTTQPEKIIEMEFITQGTPFEKISSRTLEKNAELYGKDRLLEALDILVETYKHKPDEVRNPSSLLASGLRLNNLVPPDGFIPWHERMKKEQERNKAARLRREVHAQDRQAEEKMRQLASAYYDSLDSMEKEKLLARAQEQIPPFLRGKEFITRMAALEIVKKEVLNHANVTS